MGTRLLSVTKEQPKEMLPVFAKGANGDLCLKPIVQLVFEQLFQVGFREFCFVVGRGKRAIEDHFTPDFSYVSLLDKQGKAGAAEMLQTFYDMVDSSTIVWVNQSEPRGFGDAVLKARSFVQREDFLVHAGDNYFLSRDAGHLKRLISASESLNAEATFLVQDMENPKGYGVVEGRDFPDGTMRVKGVSEKPALPLTNRAIVAVYVFRSSIFEALEVTPAGFGGEIQLTDGIQRLVDRGLPVCGVKVRKDEIRLDIGSPDSYWEAQNLAHKYFSQSKVEHLLPSI